MIKNDVQYRLTKAYAEKFERALTELRDQPPADEEVHPLLRQAEIASVHSQLADLQAELSEYESLRDGKQSVADVASVEDLPRAHQGAHCRRAQPARACSPPRLERAAGTKIRS